MSDRSPSSAELLAMQLLRDSPSGMYGLEMVEASSGRFKRGTVYITLGRLEESGFVKSRTQRANPPDLPRPIYRLTALGERALHAAEIMGLNASRGVAYEQS
jgi:DNA-binding PadR family transcriptional regulator